MASRADTSCILFLCCVVVLCHQAVLSRVSNTRDTMTNDDFDAIIADVKKVHVGHIDVVKGTVTHEEVLGNTLEGLVIHASALTGDDLTHDAVVKSIEQGQTNVFKFKFPAYTVRTMCIRSALGQRSQNGGSGFGGSGVDMADLEPFVTRFVNHWCITEEGRAYWAEFAWEAMLLAADKPAEFPSEHESTVGQLIKNDYIAPPFLKKWCQNLNLRCVLLSDPSTFGTGGKTRLESSLKRFNLHFIYD